MKYTLSCLLIGLAATVATAQVKPGVEVLRDGGFEGLQANAWASSPTPPASTTNSNLPSTSSRRGSRREAHRALRPEHGVRGDVHAGDKVDNMVDPATGVPCIHLRQDPQTVARDAQRHRRPHLRHPGQRLPLLHIHQHHGPGHGGLRRAGQDLHGARPPQPRGRQQKNRGQPYRGQLRVVRKPVPHTLPLRPHPRANSPCISTTTASSPAARKSTSR